MCHIIFHTKPEVPNLSGLAAWHKGGRGDGSMQVAELHLHKHKLLPLTAPLMQAVSACEAPLKSRAACAHALVCYTCAQIRSGEQRALAKLCSCEGSCAHKWSYTCMRPHILLARPGSKLAFC